MKIQTFKFKFNLLRFVKEGTQWLRHITKGSNPHSWNHSFFMLDQLFVVKNELSLWKEVNMKLIIDFIIQV